MKMLKISLVAALALGGLALCTSVASAQDATNKGKGRGQMVEQRVDNMAKELNLTDDQKTKVKAAMEEQGKKMQEMRGDGNSTMTPEQRREKFTAMREELDKKMKAILTPEQYEKYQKSQAERKGRGPGGQGGGKKKE